ncbi:hypothetical protein D3C72_1189190 [compost metagenome]
MHLPLHLLPAAGFESYIEADGPEHGAHRLGQIPPGAVTAGVPEGESGAQPALVADAVTAPLPARGFEQGVGMGGIPVLEGAGRVVPGQPLHRAVGGDGVPLQQLIGQQLAIDGVVDGAAHRHVRGYVVADGVALGILAAGGWNGEDDAAVLHARAHPEPQRRRHRRRQGGGDAHHVELAALGGGIGALLVDEDEHQPLEVVVLPGVIGIFLHHQLLAGQEASQPVGAGAYRLAGVALGIVIPLRHYAERPQHVDEGALGGAQADGHLQRGDHPGGDEVAHVDLATTLGGAVVGEGHILGIERRAVGELKAGLEADEPALAILARADRLGQQVLPAQVGPLLEQRAVQQQVAAVAPAEQRIEALGGFAADGELELGGHGLGGGTLRAGAHRDGQQHGGAKGSDRHQCSRLLLPPGKKSGHH